MFTDLARKAGSLARRESLTGWLYTGAHYAASKIARTEVRRRHREEIFMHEPSNECAEVGRVTPCAPEWEEIRPALDDAMHELKETDREAILLRYFENRPLAELGTKLGLNENAARMRVERALEKLRIVFVKRGITTATALASVISANAVQMAPAGLATTLATTSVAAVGTGTAFTLLKFMTATQFKLGISALVVAGTTTALVVQYQTQNRLRGGSEVLRQQIAQLENNNASLSNRLVAVGAAKSLTDEQMNELLRLRGEVGALRAQTNELVRLRTALSHAEQSSQSRETYIAAAQQKKSEMLMSDVRQLVLGMIMYAADNQKQYPSNIDQTTRYFKSDALGELTNQFEIVYEGSGSNIASPSSTIVVQQSQVWQTYDGKWAKAYGFADGHSIIHTELDNDFSAFEQQHSVSSSPNQ